MKRLILVCVLAIALLLVWISPSLAAPTNHLHVSDYIDKTFLEPVHSVLTGDMFVHNRDYHGIPIVDQLVLLKMESTLGASNWATNANNFGCVKYFKARTILFGKPVPNYIWHWGSRWYKFRTPKIGMCQWGRFIERWGDGWFLGRLKAGDWIAVARVYNGGSTYAARCRALDIKYTAMFKAAGYPMTAAGYTP